MEQTLKEKLMYSLDQDLNIEAQTQLDVALIQSEDLRQEKEQLLQMRVLLSNLQVGRDSDFPARVITRLQDSKNRSFFADLVSISPRIAAACLAFMIMTVIGVYIRHGSLSGPVVIGTEFLTPEDGETYSIENDKLTRTRLDKATEMPKSETQKPSDNGRLH